VFDDVQRRNVFRRFDGNRFDDFGRLLRGFRLGPSGADVPAPRIRRPKVNPFFVVAEVFESAELSEANVARHRRKFLLYMFRGLWSIP